MRISGWAAGLSAALVAASVMVPATAHAFGAKRHGGYYGMYRGYSKYRRGPQVRGYVARRGGYSYAPEDVINTYGDSRTRYGSTNSYRNFWVDRQTQFGPFDNGFFFDSGIAPNGGNSPYMN